MTSSGRATSNGSPPYQSTQSCQTDMPRTPVFFFHSDQGSGFAAMLREHIVPGAGSAADIGKAIDAADDKAVKIRTMGVGALTFRKSGSGIQVTSGDGASAMLAGPEVRANGSVAIPVDGVLKKI